jgi:2-C-methyl-D-erythritol 2,4-cyclodiphosphate synthase
MKTKKNIKTKNKLIESIRVGFGYDVHPLIEGRKLILGGVNIPSDTGLLGHSDADVLLHAICDALLGAAALGDIGKHFPDTDETYRGISSSKLLKHVGILLQGNGYKISNIDSTIILEKPKISKYVDSMRKLIAKALLISHHQVSIKATTHEGLGAFGRGEGCAAYAVASIIGVNRV